MALSKSDKAILQEVKKDVQKLKEQILKAAKSKKEKQAEIDAIRNEMAAQIRVLEAEMAALAAEDSTLTEVAATGQAMADVECDVYETETCRVVVLKGGMPSDPSQIIESVYITPPQPPQQEA